MAEAPLSESTILDIGSATIKAGVASADAPSAFVSTTPPLKLGAHALPARVLKRGVITDFEGLQQIMHTTITKTLKREADAFPLILTESVFAPRPHREKLAQIALESFGAPSMYLLVRNVASLLASGRTTGVVLQSGDELTSFVPIYECSPIIRDARCWDFGGRDVTRALAEATSERSNVALTLTEAEALKHAACLVLPTEQARELPSAVRFADPEQRAAHIGDTLTSMTDSYLHLLPRELRASVACYHARTPECERQAFPVSSLRTPFTLPDGRHIAVDGAPLVCAEGLFRPALIGRGDESGMHRRMYDALHFGDFEYRNTWATNMVISGGNTLMRGFSDRLLEEVVAELYMRSDNYHFRARITAPRERLTSSFIGASILGSLSTFEQTAITKEEYSEVGPNIVHRKCW